MPDQPPKGTDFLAATFDAPVGPAEAALRPLSFSDFTWQTKTIERLQVMVGAAKRRGDALNHILLSGPSLHSCQSVTCFCARQAERC